MSEASVKSCKIPSPSHRRRSGQFSLEELSDDDIGYDADVEVVRPEYEDAESGNEDDTQEDDNSTDSEEHLAHRLRALYCDPKTVSSGTQQSTKKGRKRMSKDMEGTKTKSSMRTSRSEIEVWELSVHTDDKHPAKRQRNRLARSRTGDRIVQLIPQGGAENGMKSGTDSSNLASSIMIEGPATSTSEMQDLEMTG
jgi:hypothetical protein